jgi:hypothetical protein
MRPNSCCVPPDGAAPGIRLTAPTKPHQLNAAPQTHTLYVVALRFPTINWILYDNALEQFGSICEGFDRD